MTSRPLPLDPFFPNEGDDDAVLVHVFESEQSRVEFVSRLARAGSGGEPPGPP